MRRLVQPGHGHVREVGGKFEARVHDHPRPGRQHRIGETLTRDVRTCTDEEEEVAAKRAAFADLMRRGDEAVAEASHSAATLAREEEAKSIGNITREIDAAQRRATATYRRLYCSNCGVPISAHCRVHAVPCCPGKCSEASMPRGR